MKNPTPLLLGGGALVALALVAVLSLAGMYISAVNTEVELRAQFDAKQAQATLAYDQMWKVIEEQAGVSESYSAGFGEIYEGIMEGRYGEAGGERDNLMLWIQEDNPEFDTSLMASLISSIEEQRTISTNVQTELLAVVQAHTTHTSQIPASLFVKNRCCLEAQIVTSTRTEQTFETGRDDRTLEYGQ